MLSRRFVYGRCVKVFFTILLLFSTTFTFSMEFLTRYFARPQSCDASTQVNFDEQETSHSMSEDEQYSHKEIEKGVIVRVVSGPERLRNKVMEIKGTSEEVWGIKDVFGSSKAMGIYALSNYMFDDNGPDDFGIVYYGKEVKWHTGYCVHESWIVPAEAEDDRK